MGLMTSSHAWVLPAYYNPNWWRIAESESDFGDCSNEDMEAILESVLFIKNVKYPPMVRQLVVILWSIL